MTMAWTLAESLQWVRNSLNGRSLNAPYLEGRDDVKYWNGAPCGAGEINTHTYKQSVSVERIDVVDSMIRFDDSLVAAPNK